MWYTCNVRAGPTDRHNLLSSNFGTLVLSSCCEANLGRVILHFNITTNDLLGVFLCVFFYFVRWDLSVFWGFFANFDPQLTLDKNKK